LTPWKFDAVNRRNSMAPGSIECYMAFELKPMNTDGLKKSLTVNMGLAASGLNQICCGPCGFYLGHIKNPRCNVM